MIQQNDIVAHPIFGEGVIVATRWDGAETQVQFRSGLRLWLPSKWLKTIAAPRTQLDQISSKRLLEAFRLGVVPHQDIESFTFGRGYEINELEILLSGLKEGTGDVCLIEGVYGSGKTHLLEYTRHLALKRGFVTAYCELNTQETPLHRPKRVYRELMYNLRFIKDNCEYQYRDLLRLLSSQEISDHCFFTPVFKTLKHIEDGDPMSEVFWQWIEGESTKNYATDTQAPFRVPGGQKIPALYDFSTAADFYSYLFTGLSHMIYQAGLGGLVIIVDEVETIAHTWDYHAYSRGLGFLEAFILATYNTPALRKIEHVYIHNKVRPTPYIYKEPYVLLILAMTPAHGLRGMSNVVDTIRKKMYLRKFSRPELEVIYENLRELYQNAYPGFMIEPARSNNIFNTALRAGSGELREFIKFSVEAFDWIRLGISSRH